MGDLEGTEDALAERKGDAEPDPPPLPVAVAVTDGDAESDKGGDALGVGEEGGD